MLVKKGRTIFYFIIAASFFSIALAQSPNQSSTDASQTVKLSVIVTDKEGKPAKGLREEAFQVFEEGKEQKIIFFSAEEAALSYGILIDSSGSMKPKMKGIEEAVNAILSSNRAGDETFIASVSDAAFLQTSPDGRTVYKPYAPTLLVDWTEDKSKLMTATSNLQAMGRTALLDSIYFCTEQLGKRRGDEDMAKRRRVLVIITDGLEKDSYYKLDEFLNLAKKLDVQIFAIGLTWGNLFDQQFIFRRSQYEEASSFLGKITKETGGSAFFLRTADETRGIAAHITELMRSQYVIGYVSPQGKKDYRKVRVTVKAEGRNKLLLTARPGYTFTVRAETR